MRGENNMTYLKKVVYFTVGVLLVPFILGLITLWLVGSEDYETFYGFWCGVYLLIYIFFPFVYRGKIAQKIPNKYVMYAILYSVMGILFLWALK